MALCSFFWVCFVNPQSHHSALKVKVFFKWLVGERDAVQLVASRAVDGRAASHVPEQHSLGRMVFQELSFPSGSARSRAVSCLVQQLS